MIRRTRRGLEDVTQIETCLPTHVQVRTASMPNVDELCDSVRQHTPEFGGLGDNCDDDRLEVLKGEVISQ